MTNKEATTTIFEHILEELGNDWIADFDWLQYESDMQCIPSRAILQKFIKGLQYYTKLTRYGTMYVYISINNTIKIQICASEWVWEWIRKYASEWYRMIPSEFELADSNSILNTINKAREYSNAILQITNKMLNEGVS